MNVINTSIPEVLIIKPKIFDDDRGFFFESFNQAQFDEVVGRKVTFVQDNHSKSVKNVLRGLHYQIKQPQGKLVRVLQGAVLDVAVDIRRSSPTFGQHVAVELSSQNKLQLWVPEGFAHGFLVISDTVEFLYKATDYYAPQFDRAIIWNDEKLAINWTLKDIPLLSKKDQLADSFCNAEVFS